MTLEFTPWPKTPRLFRDAVITEKIDGTNAAVVIQRQPLGTYAGEAGTGATAIIAGTEIDDRDGMPVYEYVVAAQSRKRLITPEDDNFGFAAYVQANATDLVRILGEGTHYGEWWGHGIQRGYGLAQGDRRFSLFNVHRYGKVIPPADQDPYDPRPRVPGLGLVPVLDTYTFDTARVSTWLGNLAANGSHAAPGFMRPEGVIVFHSQSGQVFKALLENDDVSKTEAGVA